MIPKVDFNTFKVKETKEHPIEFVVKDHEGNKIEEDVLHGEYQIQQFLDEYLDKRKKDEE